MTSALSILATFVTAAATLALWRVTIALAKATQRMAQATAQPQVVVSIESNGWSFHHADLAISNTGNATAFDISISFDPPLVINLESRQQSVPTPFTNISLLKPGQELRSWIGQFSDYLDSRFTVSVSWRCAPGGEIEQYSYILDLGVFRSVHRLGSGDPLVEIATATKRLKEDFHRVIESGKIRIDSYDERDRAAQRTAWKTYSKKRRKRSKLAAMGAALGKIWKRK